MGRQGGIDIDVGQTHLHLNRPSGYASTPSRSVATTGTSSSIKQLNDAVNELTNTYSRAVHSLEEADEAHMQKSYTYVDPEQRTSLDVLREKMDLEKELQKKSLYNAYERVPEIKPVSDAMVRAGTQNDIRSSPYLNITSPYFANLEPRLRPYADKFLAERVMVRKMMQDGKLCNNLRIATEEANGELRNWLLEYSGMGSYTTTRMLEIAQKIQDLLEQIREKDEAYSALDQAMADKIKAIDDLKIRAQAQQKSDEDHLNGLVNLTSDLQKKLKQTNADQSEFLKQLKRLQGDEQSLAVQRTGMQQELVGSKARTTYLSQRITDQTASLAQARAVQAASHAAREQLLNEKIQLALDGQRKQDALRDTLQQEKAQLEAMVQAAQANKDETEEEFSQARDIAVKLQESLKKELTVAQYWQDAAQEVSRIVVNAVGPVTSLQPVGTKYLQTVENIIKTNAAVVKERKMFVNMKSIATKEFIMIQEEHKRIKSLTKHLVEEEHHEKDLCVQLEMSLEKYNQMRSLAIMNDAQHKKNEADIQMLIEQTKEERDRDQSEMKVAVENALKKVEEAKLMARNAKAISSVMDRQIRYGF